MRLEMGVHREMTSALDSLLHRSGSGCPIQSSSRPHPRQVSELVALRVACTQPQPQPRHTASSHRPPQIYLLPSPYYSTNLPLVSCHDIDLDAPVTPHTIASHRITHDLTLLTTDPHARHDPTRTHPIAPSSHLRRVTP